MLCMFQDGVLVDVDEDDEKDDTEQQTSSCIGRTRRTDSPQVLPNFSVADTVQLSTDTSP